MLAVSVFVIFGFLASCSKKDRNKIINGGGVPDVNTVVPNDTMAGTEKNAIESSETLNPADYEIFELRFASNFITGSPQEFTIVNNAIYTFVFGLKNKNSGDILYKDISVSAWDFSSDNSAIIKNGNTGFNASNTFYSDKDADIAVNISYKGLHKNFNFVLKSNKTNPNISPFPALDGTWIQSNVKFTFSGNTVVLVTLDNEVVPAGTTATATYSYNPVTREITISPLQSSNPAINGLTISKWSDVVQINTDIIQIRPANISEGTNADYIYREGYYSSFTLQGEWICQWPGTEYRLIFSGSNFTFKTNGSITVSGTYTANESGITFSQQIPNVATNTVFYCEEHTYHYKPYMFGLNQPGYSHMSFSRIG